MFQNDINNGETTSRLQLASAVDTGKLGLLKALSASIEVFVEVIVKRATIKIFIPSPHSAITIR